MSEVLDSDLKPRRLPQADPGQRSAKRAVRFAWLAAGWIFFAVGVIGVAIPGLPTTGPMLLAIACFARGSEHLHRWLLNHRLFGPSIRRWQRHRVIPIRAKVTAVSMMIGSIAFLVLLSPLPTWGLIVTIGFVVVGIVVVLSLPHKTLDAGTDDPAREQVRPRPEPHAPSLLPREHGVYAEVLFPVVTALSLGSLSLSGVLFAVSIVAAFLFHEPALILLGRRGARAKKTLGSRARTRAATLAALVLGCAAAGAWLAGTDAWPAYLALFPLGLLLGLLVIAKREKTLLGESLVAAILSLSSVPVALACGVALSVALAAAAIWTTVFLLGTATVHAILARHKRGTALPAIGVAAVALILVAGATTMVALRGQWWPVAVLPISFVILGVIAVNLPPKRLRFLGWSLVVSNIATMAILIGAFHDAATPSDSTIRNAGREFSIAKHRNS